MADLNIVAASHLADSLSVRDFLMALKRSRRLRPLLLETFVESLLVDRAKKSGLTVTEDDLQKAADNFRLRNGMAGAEQTQQWLRREGITPDDFATGLERDLLVEKMRQKIADPQVQEAFNSQTARFARVKMKRILVATEPEAREIIDLVANNKSTFEEQARAKSLDLVTKAAGGDSGLTRRVDLLPQVAEVVFATEVGKMTPPVTAGQGFLVLLIEEFLPAELDDTVRNGLRREIFDVWLRNELSKAPIEFPVLRELSIGQKLP